MWSLHRVFCSFSCDTGSIEFAPNDVSRLISLPQAVDSPSTCFRGFYSTDCVGEFVCKKKKKTQKKNLKSLLLKGCWKRRFLFFPVFVALRWPLGMEWTTLGIRAFRRWPRHMKNAEQSVLASISVWSRTFSSMFQFEWFFCCSCCRRWCYCFYCCARYIPLKGSWGLEFLCRECYEQSGPWSWTLVVTFKVREPLHSSCLCSRLQWARDPPHPTTTLQIFFLFSTLSHLSLSHFFLAFLATRAQPVKMSCMSTGCWWCELAFWPWNTTRRKPRLGVK